MAGLSSYNSVTDIQLGNVPQVDDPTMYSALLEIYTAIEALTTAFSDTEEGLAARVAALENYVNARLNVVTITSDHTISITDGTIVVDASSNMVTVYLPQVSGYAGSEFNIKVKSAKYGVFISPYLAETIDWSADDVQVYKHESVTLKATSDGWIII